MDALTAARAAHVAGVLLLAGTLLLGRLVLPAPPRGAAAGQARAAARGMARLAAAVFALAAATLVLWVCLTAADMAEETPGEALRDGSLARLLLETLFGHLALARLALLAALGIVLMRAAARGSDPPRPGRAAPALAALLAGSLALAGHAAETEGAAGLLHAGAHALHIVAAGAWLGALPGLLLLVLALPAGAAAAAAQAFSRLGLAAVALLVATGAVDFAFMVGSLPALLGTRGGHLLLAKLAAFAALLALAGVNRGVLTPRLARGSAAARRLLAVTIGLGFLGGAAAVALAALLATGVPAAHDPPWWPLPRRPSLEALAEPELREEVLSALGACALGAGAVVLALLARRRPRLRLAVALAGAGLILWQAPVPVTLLSVAATPTSYHPPIVPYDAAVLARAAALYPDLSAGCHGPEGRGDGPLAGGLPVPPADLEADHILFHPVGDLYWWIGEGMAEGAMPGLAARLAPDDRWALAHLARSLAAARRFREKAPGADLDPPAEAPDIVFEDGAGTGRLSDLLGRPVVLAFAEGGAAPAPAAREATEALRRMARLHGARMIALAPGGGGAAEVPQGLARTGPESAAAWARLAPPGALAGSLFLIDPDGAVRERCGPQGPGCTPGWLGPALARLASGAAPAAAPRHVHRG